MFPRAERTLVGDGRENVVLDLILANRTKMNVVVEEERLAICTVKHAELGEELVDKRLALGGQRLLANLAFVGSGQYRGQHVHDMVMEAFEYGGVRLVFGE